MSEQKIVKQESAGAGGARYEWVRQPYSRRQVLRLAGAGALGGLAAGGLAKRSAFAAPAFLQGEPTTIQYVTWFWNEPGRAEAWRFLIDKFHKEQNEIRVEEAGWNFDQFAQNIIVQIQAGKVEGDVIQTTPDLVLRLLNAGKLVPLEDIIQRLEIPDLSPAHDYIRRDGHLYGLDVVTVQFGLLYNSTLFEQDNVPLPTNIDEWVDVSTRLTKRPNQFGIYSPHSLQEPNSFWFTLQEWAMPSGGVPVGGKEPLATSEPILQGLQLCNTMYDNAFPQGTDDSTAWQLSSNHQIAQQLSVSALVNVYRA